MRSMTVDNDGDSLAVVFLDRNISDEIQITETGDELMNTASKIPAGQKMVLDFKNVEYFASAMIGQLVKLRRATERDSVELILRHVSPMIQSVLRATHLDKVFRIEDPTG